SAFNECQHVTKRSAHCERFYQLLMQILLQDVWYKRQVDSIQQALRSTCGDLLVRKRRRQTHETHENRLSSFLFDECFKLLFRCMPCRKQGWRDGSGGGAEQTVEGVPAPEELLTGSHKDHTLGAPTFEHKVIFH